MDLNYNPDQGLRYANSRHIKFYCGIDAAIITSCLS